ncbi:MAG: hypothetical protein LBJ02_02645 [Bifidobacteriaceae bacterium]|jgi:hypothetical protein|nr:hypothetical protein [Bifidobacteriaceae bacterium]
MPKLRSLVVTGAGALLLGLSACVGAPNQADQAAALDRQNLIQALDSLAGLAAVCAAAPPDGFKAAGLALLADHAPVWLVTVSADDADAPAPTAATAPSPAQATDSACEPEALRRDLARVRTLAVRLSGAGPADGPKSGAGDSSEGGTGDVLVAITRASAVDEALVFDTLDVDGPPAVEDLANAEPAQLTDLALAEDQARFVGEYLAGQVSDQAMRTRLETAAESHRLRAERLVALSGENDPRQPVYQLGPQPTTAAAAAERWAATELALASHYAALPAGTGNDLLLRWHLGEAAAWGAALPALPFLE